MIRKKDLPIKIITIYVDVSPKIIEKRMIKQKRSKLEINKRLKQLQKDVSIKEKCDYIIYNSNNLTDSIHQFHKIMKKIKELH